MTHAARLHAMADELDRLAERIRAYCPGASVIPLVRQAHTREGGHMMEGSVVCTWRGCRWRMLRARNGEWKPRPEGELSVDVLRALTRMEESMDEDETRVMTRRELRDLAERSEPNVVVDPEYLREIDEVTT